MSTTHCRVSVSQLIASILVLMVKLESGLITEVIIICIHAQRLISCEPWPHEYNSSLAVMIVMLKLEFLRPYVSHKVLQPKQIEPYS